MEKDKNRRDVLVSIQPRYASKIIEGTKSVELRRRFPETIETDSRILIYSTSPIQAIVGYAVVNAVQRMSVRKLWQNYQHAACIERGSFDLYFDGLKGGYAILLGEVKRFKRTISVEYLRERFGFVPPQSFRYITPEYHLFFRDDRVQVTHRHKHLYRA